jgi:HAE1 family hydrophobic/amphiphilic exporter-1
MGAAVAAIVLGVMVAKTLPSAFDARTDRSEFLANIELPFGAGIEETRAVAARVAHALHGVEHVKTVFFTVGSGAQQNANEAAFDIGLTPKKERDVSFVHIMDEARGVMQAAAPEAKSMSLSDVPWISGGSFGAYAIMYALKGPDLAVLDAKANMIVAKMRQNPLFADVKTSYDSGKPEVQVHIDRKRAADLGIPVRSLAETVRTMVGGVKAGSFEEYGQRYDVRVRLEEEQRDDIAKLSLIQVRGPDGRLIDINNVASFEVASGPAQIERQNRSRRIAILANTPAGVALGPATQAVEAYLKDAQLPANYSWSAEGPAKSMKETGQAIGFAFLLALIALYMILASQFNSFAQPAIIMLSAPLSFVGAFISLKLSGLELTMFAQIGLLALMGLVMKNGILLVDYTNQLRAQGMPLRDALLAAGPVRLRPVLMTQIATIFGMIPVAISTSQGAEVRNAMGFVAIGGLISSTMLTLVVVPVAYLLLETARRRVDRAAAWVRRRFAGLSLGRPKSDPPGAPAE